MEESGGKTTIVKNNRSVLITIPSRWQIKEDPQRASILGREINIDSALAIIKTVYEISFSTSKSSDERPHDNCGKFKMSISVSDFKHRHPNLTSKNRTKLNSDIHSVASLLSGEFGLKSPSSRTINQIDQPRPVVQPINKPNIIDPPAHPPNPIHLRINHSVPVINNPVKPRNRLNNSWNPRKPADVFPNSPKLGPGSHNYQEVYPTQAIIKPKPENPPGSKPKNFYAKFGNFNALTPVLQKGIKFLQGPPPNRPEICPQTDISRPNIDNRNGSYDYPRPKTSTPQFGPSFTAMKNGHHTAYQKGNSWPRVPGGQLDTTGDVAIDDYISRNLPPRPNPPPPGMEEPGFGCNASPGWGGSSWSNLEGSCQSNTYSTEPMTGSLYESISKYEPKSEFNTPSGMHDHLGSPPPSNSLSSSASNNNLSSIMKNSTSSLVGHPQQHQLHQGGGGQQQQGPSHRRTNSWTGTGGFQLKNHDGIGLR